MIPITVILANISTLGARSFLKSNRVIPDKRIIAHETVSRRNSVSASRYHIYGYPLYNQILLSTTSAISETVFIG